MENLVSALSRIKPDATGITWAEWTARRVIPRMNAAKIRAIQRSRGLIEQVKPEPEEKLVFGVKRI
jgi:hypothetical protein